MILLIGGEKGGTGKTTIATNLATMRTRAGKDVLIVDTDLQFTANYWCSSREDYGVAPRINSIQKFGKSVGKEIETLKAKYDDIVIDAGGRDSPELRASMLVADIALIPVQASQFDLWTLTQINKLVGEIKQVNEKLRTLVCLNRVSTNPAVKEKEEAKELFTDFDNIGLASSYLSERIVFRKAAIHGMAVVELETKDVKANAEIEALYKEVFNGY